MSIYKNLIIVSVICGVLFACGSIRKGSWKLHIKTYSQTGKQYFDGKIPLLFNLNKDPSEEHDVAEEHPAVIQDLMAEIERHKKEVETTSNFFDKDLNK